MKKIGPFWISKVLGANAYLLGLSDDLKITLVFYVSYLFPYLPPNVASTFASEIEDDLSCGGEEFRDGAEVKELGNEVKEKEEDPTRIWNKMLQMLKTSVLVKFTFCCVA